MASMENMSMDGTGAWSRLDFFMMLAMWVIMMASANAYFSGVLLVAAGVSAANVADEFRRFVETVRADLPETRIAYISMKPSPARRHLLDAQREGNRRIREFVEEGEGLSYIDVFHAMLDEDGEPREELFADDRLHLNERGYELWTGLVRPRLGS